MKTNLFQLNLAAAMIAVATGLSAQTSNDNGGGPATETVTNTSMNEGGKEVKVAAHKKMEVTDMTEQDKKSLPPNVSTSGSPFSDLIMYPNPTNNNLNISYTTTSWEPLVIYIFDANGKSVYMETAKTPDLDVKKTVSLDGLGTGVYFVHLSQAGNVETRKIVLK